MNVGVDSPGELGHGVDHDLGFQGGSRRVEEMAGPGRECREIGAILVDGIRGALALRFGGPLPS